MYKATIQPYVSIRSGLVKACISYHYTCSPKMCGESPVFWYLILLVLKACSQFTLLSTYLEKI